MVWYFIAAAAVVAYLVGTRLYDRRRVVGKKISPEELEYCLRSSLLHGRSGTRIFIYHRESSTMIVVVKTLTPSNLRTGAVDLHVSKKSIPRPSKWKVDRAKKFPVRGFAVERVMVWSWDLPSPDGGETLLEVDCGASLASTFMAIHKMIQDDEQLRDGRFYEWGEGITSSRVMGTFEDVATEE